MEQKIRYAAALFFVMLGKKALIQEKVVEVFDIKAEDYTEAVNNPDYIWSLTISDGKQVRVKYSSICAHDNVMLPVFQIVED